jgi:cysteine desulfurase family protein (TIGR01976 family)
MDDRALPDSGSDSGLGHDVGYDVAAVRSRYPALADGYAYLDGAAGTQVPRAVIDAESAAYAAGLGNHGGAFPASKRSDALTAAARSAMADLVGTDDPEAVVLGPSMTALTYRFAEGFARTWQPGDEIVLSRLDHDGNVRPWVQAAERAGVVVRWAEPRLPEIELPVSEYDGLLSGRTRLVALTAASNVVGTRPQVRAICDAAHDVGAVTYVDGVHATPHGPVDVGALGADFYATSAYKWSGPHLAAVVGDRALLEGLHPDRLASASAQVPERFERGTSPFAQHAGLVAAVEHLAGLADPPPGAVASGSRRGRLVHAMQAVQQYEQGLLTHLLNGLNGLPHVRRVGAPRDPAPTVWFLVHGHHPDAVASHCARAGVNVWSGHNYAWELAGLLGIRDEGSAVRAGLSCYSTRHDVDRLLGALADLG